MVEQRTITDTTTPTEQFEEFERPKTFFEDFRTEYNFPSYERGEDRRIKIDGNEGWTLYNQPVTGKSGMIGETAITLETLNPDGQIKIDGEIWNAISKNNKKINKNEQVEIVSIKGLTLFVQKAKSKNKSN